MRTREHRHQRRIDAARQLAADLDVADSCEATLRRISVIEPIDRLIASQPRLVGSVRNRPVARGRDAVRRDRQAMPGTQLADALQQRRLAGHIAERQLLVDVRLRRSPP